MKRDLPSPKIDAPLAKVMRDRRSFLSGGAMLAGGSLWATPQAPTIEDRADSPVQRCDSEIRVGLIGCGHHGTSSMIQLLSHRKNVRLVAMADRLDNQLQASYRAIRGRSPDNVDEQLRRFGGSSASLDCVKSDLDAVVVAVPARFAPAILSHASDYRKHVCLLSPPGIDEPSVLRCRREAESFDRKGLSIVCPSPRLDAPRTSEAIDFVRTGGIGTVASAKILWSVPRSRGGDDSEVADDALQLTHEGWRILRASLDDSPTIPLSIERGFGTGYRLEVQISGARGVADLVAGIVRDASGSVIWKSTEGRDITRGVMRWLESIEKSQPINELDTSTNAALNALRATTV